MAELPAPDDLPSLPRGVVLHWTAGGLVSTEKERWHYHWLVEHHEGDPTDPTDDRVRIRAGVPPENQLRDLTMADPTYHPRKHPDGYGAHVARWNNRRLGVALCGMRDAVDHRPDGDVDPGPSPITRRQVLGTISLCISICRQYGLDPVPEQLCMHEEVERLHGVDQAGKWDIGWIPGSGLALEECGPWIREQVRRGLEGKSWADALDVRGDRAADHVAGMVA